MAKSKTITISRIAVKNLFGLYNYEIPTKSSGKDIEKTLILYGDNGSGKTTILRLIFHALACERRASHKTFVAQTKFRELTLGFSDGSEVQVIRKGESLLGSFTMILKKDGKTLCRTTFVANTENVVKAGGAEDEDNERFMKFMEKLNLTLYLLADDRTVHVTSAARQIPRYMSPMVAEEEVQSAISSEEPRRWEVIRPDPEQISIRLLEDSIRRLNRWVRNRVMQGSRRGDSDVNVIFSDIIEKFAKSVSSGRRRRATKREDLVNRINAIEQRNREYSSHGLTSPFNGQKLLYAINKASSNKFKSITPIISPYLDGLEARLQALSEIKETVEQLLKTINAFMTNKEVSFNISRARGFQIRSSTREELEPRMLSSGERHLLLLFCNTVTALDTQSIFIIDEPEISLNVKWQRNLINSLLACAKWGRVQYIFASHSVEILSQHMDKVVKLQKI